MQSVNYYPYYNTSAYIELLATGLSGVTGIQAIASDKWQANLRKKVVFYSLEDLKKMPFLCAKGALLHEMGHIMYTDIPNDTELLKKYPILKDVYNHMEDVRIHLMLTGSFGDYAKVPLNYANSTGLSWKLFSDLTKIPKVLQFAFMMLLNGTVKYNQYNKTSDIVTTSIEQFATKIKGSPEGTPFYEQISRYLRNAYGYMKPFYIQKEVEDRYRNNMSTIDDVYETIGKHYLIKNGSNKAIEIIDNRIVPLIEDWLKENPKKENDEGNIYFLGSESTKQDKTKKKKNSSKHRASAGTLTPQMIYPPINKLTRDDIVLIMHSQINRLAQNLQNILKENESIRFTGAHLTGKLLDRNVYKASLSEKRIFSKRTNPTNPKYSVYVVVDNSRSMNKYNKIVTEIEIGENVNEEKYQNTTAVEAYTGGILLFEVAKKLRFDTHFAAFSDEITEIQNTDDYWSQEKTQFGGNTDDMKALEYLNSNIDKKNNNLVFIITDGYVNTCPDYCDGIEAITRDIQKKNTTMIGLIINKYDKEDSEDKKEMNILKKRYNDIAIVENPKDIPSIVVQKLQKIIHR